MMVSVRIVQVVTAYMLALSVVELPTMFIDVLAIPVPRAPFGMSWFTGVVLAVVLMLWPIGREKPRRILGLWDAAYLSTLMVWVVLSAARGELNTLAVASAILAWVPPWAVSVAVRMHLSVFGDVAALVRAFVTVVTLLVVSHLGFLVLADVGAPLPFMRLEELVDRNSISILIVAAVFILSLRESYDRVPSWVLLAIVVLGFAHAELNHARAAKLLLVLTVVMHLGRMALPEGRAMVRLCVLLSVGTIAAVVGIAPLLAWVGGPALFGGGDAAASTSFRAGANRLLLELFASHPWTGAGWNAVLNARVAGYIGHTLYLNVAATHGVLGMAPALGAAIWRLVRGPALTADQAMTLTLITATASVVNDPMMWYGLALALPSGHGVRIEGSVETVKRITQSHLRPYYAAAFTVALAVFAAFAVWLFQRDSFVASAELQIARVGGSQLVAVESSGEAEEFVQDAVFRLAPELRDQCSVSGRVESQALLIVCKGHTRQNAVRALDQIVQPVLRRHEGMFEKRKQFAAMMSPLDYSAVTQLDEWAVILESLDEPIVRGMIDRTLLNNLRLERDVFAKNLANYERAKKLEHPSRLVGGVRVIERSRPWALCALFAAASAIAVLLSLGTGAAARAALSDVSPRATAVSER
jgi:hypothetical protein